jgi:hypothetical protein
MWLKWQSASLAKGKTMSTNPSSIPLSEVEQHVKNLYTIQTISIRKLEWMY